MNEENEVYMSFTFVFDSQKERNSFFQEIRGKYKLYPQAESGTRLCSWDTEPYTEKD